MKWAVLFALLCVGCDRIFGLDDASEQIDAASSQFDASDRRASHLRARSVRGRGARAVRDVGVKWLVLLLVGCRQIYGLDDPQLGDAGFQADGSRFDSPSSTDSAMKDPTLVAYFTFDALSSGAVADVTGNGHDASCSGNQCPTVVDGMFGNAVAFDDTPLTIANSVTIATTGPFTITAWVLLPVTPSSDGCLLSQNNGMGLCVRTDGSVELGTRLPQAQFRSSTKISLNTWTFVGVTYAAGATSAVLYVGHSPGEVGNVQAATATNGALVLGGAATGSSIDDYESTLDNLRFYERVLDSDAITVLASGGAP